MSSIVQIKDSAYDGMRSLRVYGNTVQNLWVNPSGSVNGVTFTPNSDGSISISGSPTGSNKRVDSEDIYVLKPNAQYTISIDRTLGLGSYVMLVGHDADGNQVPNTTAVVTLSGNETFETFTVPSGAVSCTCSMQVNSNGTASGTYRVMLNEGSAAEPWCPPGLNSVGDGGSVDIVTAGKNLLTETLEGVAPKPASDSPTTLIDFGRDIGFEGMVLSVTADTDLTYQVPGAALIDFLESDGTHHYLISKAILGSSGSMTAGMQKTVDVPDEKFRYINAYWLSENFSSFDAGCRLKFQLELGSTATDYEPPNITTTPIDLQGHTLNALPDGTRDELHIDGGGNVVLEKRTWSDVFDGTEGWIDSGNRYGLDNGTTFATTPESINKQMADALPVILTIDGKTGIRTFSSRWVDAGIASMQGDLAGFKAWLGNNNTTLIYKLAEPQTIDLGTIKLPKLRKKPLVNTIWANGTAEGAGFSPAPEIDCEYNRWSTYCDGFKTHGKHSYFDMGCCVAARDTGAPEKKSVTATVPYMSGYYDFSKLYGAIAFEARQLMYRFEFVEDSREELQQKKSQFLEWLSQVHDEEIADDDIPGRHFIGSLSEWEFEEGEEGQSGSLEVTFNCQPFLEADEDTTKTCNAGSNTVTVEGQAVNAYAKTSSGTATIQIGGVTQSVGTSEIRLSVQLQPGDNAVTVTGSPVVLRWKELTA